jgi:hypothetical protein
VPSAPPRAGGLARPRAAATTGFRSSVRRDGPWDIGGDERCLDLEGGGTITLMRCTVVDSRHPPRRPGRLVEPIDPIPAQARTAPPPTHPSPGFWEDPNPLEHDAPSHRGRPEEL